ncbi:hypothetical protein Goshw_005574 [Gossypium schwendimanii]|uniref:RNase H type-1 domain-containing protein n=1 Tax=Gossypium schwendimanii TaxID=34291 RepID=A0A7J9MG45_GOSSC|nr:hypothetical protein [Gossypium schwendimanii]
MDMECSLSDMVTQNNDWNLEFFCLWVSRLWESLLPRLWNSKEAIWQLLWKFQGPQRVRFFLWLALKQRLLTNAESTIRGICIDPAYGICGHESEDLLYTLSDCTTVNDIWNHLIPPDQNGEWIIGFNKYLGNCTVFDSKLWGILDSLKLALDQRFENVLIQSNSLVAINMIKDGIYGNSNSALVRRIHTILKLLNLWSLQHISREDNKLVDKIVKVVQDRKTYLRLMEESTQMSFT